MITWTDSARAALDSHNRAVRQQLLAGGADPDEVAADLRRHIEEELTAARIPVAAREDVERVLAQMGVALAAQPVPSTSMAAAAAPAAPATPAAPPGPKASLPRVLLIGLVLLGVVATIFLYRGMSGDGSVRTAGADQVQGGLLSPAGSQAVSQSQNPADAPSLSDWSGYRPAQRAFYGIGCVAAFLIVILGCFQLVGLEIHADIDHPDHNGASLFSVKPIIGFFFGFGWAGGVCSGQAALLPALAVALLAGLCAMFIIWGIVQTFVRCQNDGSMRIHSAVGQEGTVYTTIDPARGGLIQVALNTGLETLPAVTRETAPISTGTTVTVIQLDGPNLLVETKKT